MVAELRLADGRYYANGTSHLSDEEYDYLKNCLQDMDSGNEYLLEVGGEDNNSSPWVKRKHNYPLGSLNKVQSLAELQKWYEKMGEVPTAVVVQPKLDGISIALTYDERNNLVSAVTRGKDGVGDDITRNVLRMKGVPGRLMPHPSSTIATTITTDMPQWMVVRGEIVMKHADFDSLPEDKKRKNARNTASGAAKKRTGALCDRLSVVVYDIMNPMTGMTEMQMNDILRAVGFGEVVECERVTGFDRLSEVISRWEESRNCKFGYDIDGLVVKKDCSYFVTKGRKGGDDDWRYPKGKIAYKFPHQEVATVLERVRVSVKGSRIHPIACLVPVELDGVTVSSASLHNWKRVQALGLTEGAKVLVSRRNQVIPQVEQVLEHGDIPVHTPTNCPVCDEVLEYEKNLGGDESALLCCPNSLCEAKTTKQVMKWLRVHDCKGVAERTVAVLYDNKIFDDLAGFLRLGSVGTDVTADMVALPGMGRTKVEKLKKEIATTLSTDPVRFFAGLNLNGFGRTTFGHICDHIVDNTNSATVLSCREIIQIIQHSSGLASAKGIGNLSVIQLQAALQDSSDQIESLLQVVCVSPLSRNFHSSSTHHNRKLENKTFCFTGKIEGMNRKQAEEQVKAFGGIATSGISKKLDYLVTDDTSATSSKLLKARTLGIPIINGIFFQNLCR